MGVEKIAKYPSKYSGYVLLWHGVAPNEEEHAKAMQELQAQIIE